MSILYTSLRVHSNLWTASTSGYHRLPHHGIPCASRVEVIAVKTLHLSQSSLRLPAIDPGLSWPLAGALARGDSPGHVSTKRQSQSHGGLKLKPCEEREVRRNMFEPCAENGE